MSERVILGIDTSNYTTSVAILTIDGRLVANLKRLLPVKPGERGLRQSDAVFAHTVNIPELMREVGGLLSDYEIAAVGVSLFHKGNRNYLCKEKNGRRHFELPVTIAVILLLAMFWLCMVLLIVALLTGVHFEKSAVLRFFIYGSLIRNFRIISYNRNPHRIWQYEIIMLYRRCQNAR